MHIDRRGTSGIATALAITALACVILVPFRSHLAIATAGLVLVVPVVFAVAVGGTLSGIIGVIIGFVAFDMFFIPPYGTLAVGAGENWLVLAVYVAVLIPISVLVQQQRRSAEDARQRELDAHLVADLSQALVDEDTQVPQRIVDALAASLELDWTVMVVPDATGSLHWAASAGTVPREKVNSALKGGGLITSNTSLSPTSVRVVPLVTEGTPVGVIVLSRAPKDMREQAIVDTLANQAAVSGVRSELRRTQKEIERHEVAEETYRALLRAVSHDLRTPLATITTALSELSLDDQRLGHQDRSDLLTLASAQAVHLDQMVTNLLDAARIEAGMLVATPQTIDLEDLLREAVRSYSLSPSELILDCPPRLTVMVDHHLIGHVLNNLIDNALRHASTPITLRARDYGESAEVAVCDSGSSIALGPPSETPGRLGLYLVREFLAAHESSLVISWTREGSTMSFRLPRQPQEEDTA